jgi:hypothetical protein
MGKSLSGYTQITSQDLYSSSSDKLHDLGQRAITSDGREFRYCKAGELLVTGDLYTNSAVSTNFVSMATPSASAINTSDVEVTLGGTAVTANLFDEGYLIVSAGTGIGQQFQILSHDVQATTTGACTFTIKGELAVALVAASSTVTVVKNPYDSIVKSPVTPTGIAVGVAVYAIASGEYGWIQTGGLAGILMDATTTGADTSGVSPTTTTAGTATLAVTTDARIGNSLQMTSVSAAVAPIQLVLD